MSSLNPFSPIFGSTVTISASTTSASVSLSSMTSRPQQIVITNSGSNIAFVRYGIGAQTATVADLPILPNAAVVLSLNPDSDTLAAITASGATAIYATVGNGE